LVSVGGGVAGVTSVGIVATGTAGVVPEAAGAALVSEVIVAAAAGSTGAIIGAGLVSAGGGVAGLVSAAGLSGSGATGAAGVVPETAGVALVSEVVVAAAAGSAGVIVGAGLVSADGGVAGLISVGIVAAGATGATSIGVGSFVVVVAAGIVALAAGVVALAGTVLVAGLLGGTFAAPAGVTTTGGGWVWFVSISLIFCSKAARAAAGVSSARTEMKLAQMPTAQTVGNNFMICISFFYANLPSDATAFPVVENNFCHIRGRG
jgi:hypothetical protein